MTQKNAAPHATTAPTAQTAPSAPSATPAIPQQPSSLLPPVPANGQWNISDVVGLRARRSELSDQLSSAQGRRNTIANTLRKDNLSGPERSGLESQLSVLDQRIARIERDIDVTGQQLASAPGSLLSSSTSSPPFRNGPSGGQVTAISIIFLLAVALPVVITMCLRFLRRPVPARPDPEVREINGRLENLERGMEAVAIEIERMSEGQRFVTKLLSEGTARPIELSNRAADALRASQSKTDR